MYAHATGTSTYSVHLFTTGYKAVKWVISWHDSDSGAQGHNPITYTNSNGFANPSEFTYSYLGHATAPITAVATDANNDTATAYFALSDTFGSYPTQEAGESLAFPYNYQGTLSQVASVTDLNDTSTRENDVFYGYTYVASAYKVGTGPVVFGVTQFDPQGNINAAWGNNGTLEIQFDSSGDVPYGIGISARGGFLVVVGQCGTGWAIGEVTTNDLNGILSNYGSVDAQLPSTAGSTFETGRADAVAFDSSDGVRGRPFSTCWRRFSFEAISRSCTIIWG